MESLVTFVLSHWQTAMGAVGAGFVALYTHLRYREAQKQTQIVQEKLNESIEVQKSLLEQQAQTRVENQTDVEALKAFNSGLSDLPDKSAKFRKS